MKNSPVSKRVTLQEVGPRDGLQNEPVTLPPDVRASLVDKLVETGLRRIQIGSFVSPRRVPQMAGTDLVWRMLTRKEGVRYSVLVLNQRGLDLALAAHVPHVEIYVSASETHSMKNSGVTVESALSEASGMIRSALAQGIGVTAGIMCAFGCHYEGEVSIAGVLEIVSGLMAHGPVEIGLADTPGLADPARVTRVIENVKKIVPVNHLTIHLHDAHGRGPANLRTALAEGVRNFDAAVGGLGGCPFIPGAAGNIATEDTLEVLEDLGFQTDIDRARLLTVKQELETLLGGFSSRAVPTQGGDAAQ